MIGIALFGAGRIGHVHGPNVAAHPRAALRWVVDVDLGAATALAAPQGAKAGTDAAAALDDPAVRAVIVASPSATHAELIERAVAAGKPVYCEKPIDLDVARAAACVQRVEAAGVPVFVGFNRRFDPHHAALQQAVRVGEAGAVEIVAITSRDPEPPPLAYLEASPGALFRETMVHDADMARWLLGEEPVEVVAMASCLIEPEFRTLGEVDTAVAVLRTGNGRLARIDNSWRAAYGYDQRIEVLGSGGMVRSDNVRRTTLERFDARTERREVPLYFFPERYAESYRRALDHFVDVAEHGTEPFVTATDGYRAQVIVEAARRSAQSGQPGPITY